MMKTIIISSFATLAMLSASHIANAQQASMTVVGMSGQNLTFAGDVVYFPDGAYFNLTGNVYFGANRFIAASSASAVAGNVSSRIHLLGANQIDPSAPAAATQVDINGSSVDVDVTLYNPQNLSLSDLSFGTVTTNGNADAIALRQFAFASTHPFSGASITDNHVITNGNRFIIGPSGSLVGYDAGRYVVTNSNAGELRKQGLNAGGNFFFPIGRAEADYTPARMQVSSGGPVDYYMNVRNFSESVPDENIGGYAAAPNVSRTWMIYASAAGTTAFMDFIHPGTPMYEVNGYNRNNSNVIRFNGTGWVPNLPNDAENEALFGTPANYWAQQIQFAVPGAIGANSFYGKSNSLIVLPVRFGDFVATPSRCEAAFSWTTFAEQNLSHFVVERSYSARPNTWETVTRVTAAGNSSNLRQYSAGDANAASGEAYYRLAIVERDGRVSYSAIRLVKFDCATKLRGYPNPVENYFTLLLPQSANAFTIRVLNAAGQTVLPVMRRAAGTATLQTTGLPAGTYTVSITEGNGKTTTLKMVKN